MNLSTRLGVRGRLIVLFAVAFGALLSLLVWQSQADRQARLGAATRDLLDKVKLIAQRQQTSLARADAILNAVMLNRATQPAAAVCAPVMAQHLRSESGFLNLARVQTNGDTDCTAVPARRVNAADRDWFRQAIGSSKLVVADVVIGRVTGKPVITLAKSLRDEAGRVRGVYYLSIALDWSTRRRGDGSGRPRSGRQRWRS